MLGQSNPFQFFFVVSVSLLCSVASAGDEIERVLKPRPEVLAKLEALGDNSSCILKDTRIIEDLGDFAKGWRRMKETGPTGRDFTIKMAWMPDRKRAFFCGANHGSPHRFNDAWEYDLASNTWVLLYTPDYNDRGPITDYDKKTLVLATPSGCSDCDPKNVTPPAKGEIPAESGAAAEGLEASHGLAS